MSTNHVNLKGFILRYLSRNYAPRWFILILDLLLIALAFFITIYIKQNISIEVVPIKQVLGNGLLFCLIYGFSIIIFRVYAGIIRYTSTIDIIRLVLSVVLGSLFLYAIYAFSFYIVHSEFLLFTHVFIVSSGVIVFTLLAAFKFSVKLAYLLWFNEPTLSKRVIVLGTNHESVKVVIRLQSELKSNFRPVAFLKFKNIKTNKYLSHIPIVQYKKGELKYLFEKWNCQTLLISQHQIGYVKKNLADECLDNNIQIFVADYSENLGEKEGKEFPTISQIQIEDLLGRETISLNNEIVSSRILERTVLITGAAGSIGSEIARQVLAYKCKKLILLDIAESSLYDLTIDLQKQYPTIKIVLLVGDIRNKNVLQYVFREHNVDFLYHVAAYKHVPIMEEYPSEAILTNVLGTKNLIETALENNVSHFVMVSTDKAVNPTNVMGASKRIAEILVQALFYGYKEKAHKEGRVYPRVVTTRFGNVLGSNGSVVPLFKKQIEKGGPLTITDKNIIRYFMTISEACSLVLEAGCMGKGGELFVFDMGEPMKIYDLAIKMIRLAGKKPDIDIEIVETGLRPGEKLYEELLISNEESISTYNSKIMIARVIRVSYKDIELDIEKLIQLARDRADEMEIVKLMKKIVPEFISNNSKYSSLDK